jgi:rRNA-processing protein FCF1
MKRVFLDTNFIVQSTKWKVDFFREMKRILDFPHEIVVLDKVIDELEKLKEQGGKKREDAGVALAVLNRRNVRVVKSTNAGSVDTQILKAAERRKEPVATQDKELKRRLKAKGVPVVIIRQRSHLSLILA